MDPTQTQILLATALLSLLLTAQVAMHTGAFVALP